jgi:hypothetical protein
LAHNAQQPDGRANSQLISNAKSAILDLEPSCAILRRTGNDTDLAVAERLKKI